MASTFPIISSRGTIDRNKLDSVDAPGVRMATGAASHSNANDRSIGSGLPFRLCEGRKIFSRQECANADEVHLRCRRIAPQRSADNVCSELCIDGLWRSVWCLGIRDNRLPPAMDRGKPLRSSKLP